MHGVSAAGRPLQLVLLMYPEQKAWMGALTVLPRQGKSPPIITKHKFLNDDSLHRQGRHSANIRTTWPMVPQLSSHNLPCWRCSGNFAPQSLSLMPHLARRLALEYVADIRRCSLVAGMRQLESNVQTATAYIEGTKASGGYLLLCKQRL